MLISIISILISFAFADNVQFKVQTIDVTFSSEVEISDTGAKLECRFSKSGQSGQLLRQVPLLTRIQNLGSGSYRLIVNPGKLREWLPGFKRDQCAYVLFVFGRDLQRVYMGELFLAGALDRELTENEWMDLENSPVISAQIKQKIQNAHLIVEEIRGRSRIVIQ